MGLAGKRVFVTGGTGYIGGAVVRDLVAEGAAVTVLARRPHLAPQLSGRPAVTVVKGDVTDAATLDLAGHDVAVHAAAWVAFGIPVAKRKRFWETNVEGTAAVVDAARKAGVPKLVHVSSVAAFGETGPTPADETFVRGPSHRSFYEETKRAAHDVAMAATDLDPAVVMPGVVVGKARPWPDGRPASGRGPFDVFFQRFAAGRLPAVVTGDKATPYVHVDDVSAAIVAAAERGRGAYLLTDGDLTFRGLMEAFAARTGRKVPRLGVPVGVVHAGSWLVEKAYHAQGKVPPVATELARSLRAEMRFDSSKAKRELGWAPDLLGRLARDYA